ncbi:MAG: hypothetical protein ABEJ55_02740 [Halanaeroarchaeum sp.]
MTDRTIRSLGVAGVIGGLATVLSNLPHAWYGVRSLDSYVFSPPVLSPLWFHRVIVPLVSVIAVVGILLGLLGLVRRDWPVAGRLRRWSGTSSAIGMGLLALGVVGLQWIGSGTPSVSSLSAIAAVVLLALGVLVLLPSMLALGIGYLRTERPDLGYGLLGAIVAVPLFGFVAPAPADTLAAMLPVAALSGYVGVDLYRNPAPIPARPAAATADAS